MNDNNDPFDNDPLGIDRIIPSSEQPIYSGQLPLEYPQGLDGIIPSAERPFDSGLIPHDNLFGENQVALYPITPERNSTAERLVSFSNRTGILLIRNMRKTPDGIEMTNQAGDVLFLSPYDIELKNVVDYKSRSVHCSNIYRVASYLNSSFLIPATWIGEFPDLPHDEQPVELEFVVYYHDARSRPLMTFEDGLTVDFPNESPRISTQGHIYYHVANRNAIVRHNSLFPIREHLSWSKRQAEEPITWKSMAEGEVGYPLAFPARHDLNTHGERVVAYANIYRVTLPFQYDPQQNTINMGDNIIIPISNERVYWLDERFVVFNVLDELQPFTASLVLIPHRAFPDLFEVPSVEEVPVPHNRVEFSAIEGEHHVILMDGGEAWQIVTRANDQGRQRPVIYEDTLGYYVMEVIRNGEHRFVFAGKAIRTKRKQQPKLINYNVFAQEFQFPRLTARADRIGQARPAFPKDKGQTPARRSQPHARRMAREKGKALPEGKYYCPNTNAEPQPEDRWRVLPTGEIYHMRTKGQPPANTQPLRINGTRWQCFKAGINAGRGNPAWKRVEND